MSSVTKSFAIGISLCTLFFGVFFCLIGYQWWLTAAFAVGLLLLWVGWQGTIVGWESKISAWRVSLVLMGHVSFLVGCIAGLIFVVPEVALEIDDVWLVTVASTVPFILCFSFLGYTKRKEDNGFSAFLRCALWWIGLFLLFLFSFHWFGGDLDWYLSLSLFSIQLVFVIEGLWLSGSSLRLCWKGEQCDREKLVCLRSVALVFSHGNPVSSLFNQLEEFFGVDIKGTWAIQFIRLAIEPLVMAVILLCWLASSLVVIDTHEQGVRENFGLAEKQVLDSGLHWKLPWPMGAIQRVPTHRVLQINIGHEESAEKPEEKESILWANQHADEEFTLLLGDGRDLISADGTLHYRIVDVHDYLYSVQNPKEMVRSIAYRVLMHETANRTLEEALSENLNLLAAKVTENIAAEISQVSIGIEPVLFTFSALHPPVSVAESYQQVVSAQIERDTRIIRAETYQKRSLRNVGTEGYEDRLQAQREALQRTALATGEAEAFDGLHQKVRQNEDLYLFRRRQEALEKNIQGRDLLIIDHRLEKQGAQLWIKE
jgi:regulator of protease activity HflC (stomatin/prohibitin superfamily)